MSTSPTPFTHITLGRSLLTIVGLFTSTACYVADFNETHVYNPTWPAHAKFHNGQTMSMGLVLGLSTLYYLHRSPYSTNPNSASSLSSTHSSPSNNSPTSQSTVGTTPSTSSTKTLSTTPGKTAMTTAAAALERATMDIDTAALFGSLYWITQASGYLYPGSDGGMPDAPYFQLILSMSTLGVVGAGWWLERRRLAKGDF